MKHTITNQKGFTVLELGLASVLVFVLTGVGLYTFNRVNNSNLNKQQGAEQSTAQEKEKLTIAEAEKTEKVSVPTETSTVKPTPPPPTAKKTETTEKTESKSSYTSITVNLADVNINDSRALFSASWSGYYPGKCYLTVKNLTTSTYISKEGTVDGSKCSFEVPKTELPAGSYKYYMTFKNNDYTVKGSSDYITFNL
jgi:type II secretory pathway pseudopilin PulG